MNLCQNGLHPRTEDNIVVKGKGKRVKRLCRLCYDASEQRKQERKRARCAEARRNQTGDSKKPATVDVQCANCPSTFKVHRSKLGEKKHCSNKCRYEVQSRLKWPAYCGNNHKLDEDTLRVTKEGKRYCRECRNESMRKARAAKKTTCQYGHEMTPDNVAKVKRKVAGKIVHCRTCKKCQAHFVCGHPKTEANKLPLAHGGGCRTCHAARQAKKHAVASNIRSCTGRPGGKVPAPVSDDWHKRGLCRGADTDKWFPDNYGNNVDKVRATCKSCPVRKLCLAEGVGHGYGVWGGSTEKDRAEYRLGYIDFDELNERAAA